MKKNFDSLYETFGGTYREESGHLIPNVPLPEQTDYQIGKITSSNTVAEGTPLC